jgi:hypothetical protein
MAFRDVVNNLNNGIKGLTRFSKAELIVYSLVFIFLAITVTLFYFNITAENRDEERRNDLVILERALNNYFKEHGEYPRMAEWKCIEKDVLETGTFSQRIGDYLEEIPSDPLFREDKKDQKFCYRYKSANKDQEYKIYAYLERGEEKNFTEVFSLGGEKIYTGVYEEVAWFDDDWKYRKEIVIDSDQVSRDLENFPLLIKLNDKDIEEKSRRQGKDIIFVSQDNQKLKREIESYDNMTGELVAWVKIPLLSAEEDTRFYVYYGNPEVIEEESREVWDSNYVMVQHFEELFGTSYDSTVNEINGEIAGELEQNVEGKIAQAFGFDGVNDYINFGLPEKLLHLDYITLSFWAYPYEVQAGRGIIGWEGTTEGPWQFIVGSQNNAFTAKVRGAIYSLRTGKPFDVENWNYLTVTYDGTRLNYYENGKKIAVKTVYGSGKLEAQSPGDFLVVGRYNRSTVYYEGSISRTYTFNGIIDELRVSNIVRSSNWIETSFKNQNDPSLFVKGIGIQELF